MAGCGLTDAVVADGDGWGADPAAASPRPAALAGG
jgi:hypothetical protein